MQGQRSPVEAVVPSQAGHAGPPEQMAGELPAAPGGDGRVRGDAGTGSGPAALGHTGGRGVRVGACRCGCAVVYVSARACVRAVVHL